MWDWEGEWAREACLRPPKGTDGRGGLQSRDFLILSSAVKQINAKSVDSQCEGLEWKLIPSTFFFLQKIETV